jgi:hypothetical protein
VQRYNKKVTYARKNQRFLARMAIFVCLLCLGCESVESWRSGEGDGNELTNEGMKG